MISFMYDKIQGTFFGKLVSSHFAFDGKDMTYGHVFMVQLHL